MKLYDVYEELTGHIDVKQAASWFRALESAGAVVKRSSRDREESQDGPGE